MRWRDLSDAELRERLRQRSWRTDLLDGVNIREVVADRDDPTVAEFLDRLLADE